MTVTACLCVVAGQAWALGDQWYLGIGGGASWLQPNPEVPGIDLDERLGQSATVFVGADIDNRSSIQLQAYSFGEAEFDTQDTAEYFGADASVLYRLFDSRDRARPGAVFGASLYARFGLGFIERDSELDLSNDTPVYFGAGGGLEIYLHRNIALRAEALYHESDLASASLNLVTRFGGRGAQRLPDPPDLPPLTPADTATEPPASPSSEAASTPANPAADTDTDVNPGSNPGADPDADPTPTANPGANIGEDAAETPTDTTSTTTDTQRAAGNSTPGTSQPTIDDRDGDGVDNASDVCQRSAPGYPVRDNGCALFDGVLSGVQFTEGSEELLPGSFEQLDFLVRVLGEYPQSRIELLAHTDDKGTVRDQSILTRARLKTVGTYLVRKGIRANRLVLRSFGGTRPLYDNRTEDGRRDNNRIEVIENTN